MRGAWNVICDSLHVICGTETSFSSPLFPTLFSGKTHVQQNLSTLSHTSNKASTMSGGDWKAMVAACSDGDVKLVKFYLDKGVDVDFQHPEYQHTALMAAARAGHAEVCRVLLEKGADVNATANLDGEETALDCAVESKKDDVVAVIKEFGGHSFRSPPPKEPDICTIA